MRVTPQDQGEGQPQDGGAPQEPGQPGKKGSAQQAIEMITQGFDQLGQMLQAAKGQLDPQDIKLFQAAQQATNNFIQALMSPAQGQGQPQGKQQPSQPMPANANAGAQPAPQY